MIAIAEVPADLFETLAGQLPSQQHGDTAGPDDALLPGGALQIGAAANGSTCRPTRVIGL